MTIKLIFWLWCQMILTFKLWYLNLFLCRHGRHLTLLIWLNPLVRSVLFCQILVPSYLLWSCLELLVFQFCLETSIYLPDTCFFSHFCPFSLSPTLVHPHSPNSWPLISIFLVSAKQLLYPWTACYFLTHSRLISYSYPALLFLLIFIDKFSSDWEAKHTNPSNSECLPYPGTQCLSLSLYVFFYFIPIKDAMGSGFLTSLSMLFSLNKLLWWSNAYKCHLLPLGPQYIIYAPTYETFFLILLSSHEKDVRKSDNEASKWKAPEDLGQT